MRQSTILSILRTPALLLTVLAHSLRLVHSEFAWSTCHKLGFKGECRADQDCLCICFDTTANKTNVDVAFFGELGYELLLYTPMAHYYHTQGMLRKTAGPIGSEPYYRFSPDHTELDIERHFCVGPYSNPIPHLTKAEFNFEKWVVPPYRQLFNNTPVLPTDKPVVIVHNKYAKEWDEPSPVNFIDVNTLLTLFELLKHHYTVVYIRPDPKHSMPGFSADHNTMLEFDDFEEIRRGYPEVVIFQDLLESQRQRNGPGQSFNELQLLVHAQSSRLVSVQGGNAVIASHFAGTNIMYAVMGSEVENPETELQHVYPRLGDDGRGTLVHVKSYDSLLHAARQHFLGADSQQSLEAGSHQHKKQKRAATRHERLKASLFTNLWSGFAGG